MCCHCQSGFYSVCLFVCLLVWFGWCFGHIQGFEAGEPFWGGRVFLLVLIVAGWFHPVLKMLRSRCVHDDLGEVFTESW